MTIFRLKFTKKVNYISEQIGMRDTTPKKRFIFAFCLIVFTGGLEPKRNPYYLQVLRSKMTGTDYTVRHPPQWSSFYTSTVAAN